MAATSSRPFQPSWDDNVKAVDPVYSKRRQNPTSKKHRTDTAKLLGPKAGDIMLLDPGDATASFDLLGAALLPMRSTRDMDTGKRRGKATSSKSKRHMVGPSKVAPDAPSGDHGGSLKADEPDANLAALD